MDEETGGIVWTLRALFDERFECEIVYYVVEPTGFSGKGAVNLL